MNKLKLLFLFFLISILNLNAQDSTAFDVNEVISDTIKAIPTKISNEEFKGYIKDYSFSKAGIFCSFGLLNHNSKYSVLPGAGDCGFFDSGSGLGYNLGVLLNYSIFDEFLSISGKIGYQFQEFKFEKMTDYYQVYNPLKNDYENLVLNNVSNGSFKSIFFSLGMESKPFSIPLIFNCSLDFADANFGTDYKITQNIESPQIYTFNNGSSQREIISSTFTKSTALNISPSIAYEFEINKYFFISPYIEYSKSLTSPIKEHDWITDAYKFGIAIYTKFYDYPPEPKIDTITPPIIEEIKSTIIVKDEEPKIPEISLSMKPIKLTETIVTQTYPILPYIFFDSSSYKIKDQYLHKYNSDFTEKDLPKSTLDIYYYILDIIGSRLKSNPSIKIKLTGTTDGVEGNNDEDRLELAENRVQSIKEYLIKNWDVKSNRIDTKSLILPKLKTDSDFKESNQENRRVEISSNDQSLLEPVIHSKFEEYKLNNNKFLVDFKYINSDFLENETFLSLKSKNREIFSQKIPHQANSIEIDLVAPERIREIEKNPKDISIEIFYKDKSQKNYFIKDRLNIEILKEKFELGRLNLIVFDFNKSALSDFNQLVINNFIDKAIYPNSEINITGSTDKLGERDYNFKLSQQRAYSVYNFMNDKRDDINFKEIKGIGPSNLILDNDLPEGRFYSRTVLIESKTPLK